MKKLIAVIVLSVLALSFVACGAANSSPTAAAEAYIKASLNYDLEAALDLMPDFQHGEMAKLFGLSEDASRSEIIKKYTEQLDAYKKASPEDFKEHVIKDLKCTVEKEINKGDAGFEAELDKYIGGFSESVIAKIDKDKVEAFATVKASANVDGEADDQTVTCVKYDGKWYMWEA